MKLYEHKNIISDVIFITKTPYKFQTVYIIDTMNSDLLLFGCSYKPLLTDNVRSGFYLTGALLKENSKI